MKLSCLQENLAKGLSIVGRAVSGKSYLPILSNILLATDGDRLKLAATDLELSVIASLGAKVEEEGGVTIPARLLIDFVNSLPSERIDMELTERTQTLNLQCASYKANIKGIAADEFPVLPTMPEEQIVLGAETLRQMIRQVAFAAATDESRPVLVGVLVKCKDSSITMAAADGFRLSVCTAELDQPIPKPLSIIVPAKALMELVRISNGDNDVRFGVADKNRYVIFSSGDAMLASQIISGNFPDYEQIVPKNHTTSITVDGRAFQTTVKLASFFARDAANIIKIHITESGLTVSATAAETGDNVGRVDAIVEGETPLVTAFNAKYLLDFCKAAAGGQIIGKFTGPSAPGLLQSTEPGLFQSAGDDGFTHVIMPMHVER